VFHHEALCCVSWVRALPHPVVNCPWSSEIEQLAGVSSWDLVARVNTGTCSYMFQRQMSRSEILQPTSFTAVGRRFETLSWRKNSRRAGSFRCRGFPVQSWCKYPAIIVSMLSQLSQLSLEISVIPISFWSFCLISRGALEPQKLCRPFALHPPSFGKSSRPSFRILQLQIGFS